jgi:ankyrin repeat protein
MVLLLDHGADVNAQGGLYRTALQAAYLRGHQTIVRILHVIAQLINRHFILLPLEGSRFHEALRFHVAGVILDFLRSFPF